MKYAKCMKNNKIPFKSLFRFEEPKMGKMNIWTKLRKMGTMNLTVNNGQN